MSTTTEKPNLRPPTEKEQARMGWMARRGVEAKARAEAAQMAQAIATGRPVYGGTYTVALPTDLSSPEDHAEEGGHHCEQPDSNGRTFCEHVTVTLRTLADPRDRWNPHALSTAAFRAAEKARRTLRPRPSREAGEDAAADVVTAILARTAGTLPMRHDVTASYLQTAARRRMIDAATNGDGHSGRTAAEDANGLPSPAEVATDVADTAECRAQRDHDGMLDGADPIPPSLAHAADYRTLVSLAREAGMLNGPAEVANLTGVDAHSTRQIVSRGLTAARRDDGLAARLRAAAAAQPVNRADALRERAEDARREADGIMAADVYRSRPLTAWPDRVEDGREHKLTVRHEAATTS